MNIIIDLPDDILYLILNNLFNYDIFNIYLTCKKINRLMNNPQFINHIVTRYHPIVFDSWDMYCSKCNLNSNLRICGIGEQGRGSIWCRH